MAKHTVYLSDRDERFVKSMKGKLGSISEVIRVGLRKFQKEQLKEYYQQKEEEYSDLRSAQKKVLEKS